MFYVDNVNNVYMILMNISMSCVSLINDLKTQTQNVFIKPILQYHIIYKVLKNLIQTSYIG